MAGSKGTKGNHNQSYCVSYFDPFESYNTKQSRNQEVELTRLLSEPGCVDLPLVLNDSQFGQGMIDMKGSVDIYAPLHLLNFPNYSFTSLNRSDDLLLQHSSQLPSIRSFTTSIPRSPGSNHNQHIQYFIKFHLETILPAHYFWCHDYTQLCKCWLPAMAVSSSSLQYAIVAFSALIYSIKEIRNARCVAFFFYAMAVKELQLLLKHSLSLEECNIAIATVLQLSSFDVLPSLLIAN